MATTTSTPRQRLDPRYCPVDGSRMSDEQVQRWGPFLAEHAGETYDELLAAAKRRGSSVRRDLETNADAALLRVQMDQLQYFTRSVDIVYTIREPDGEERNMRHRAFVPITYTIVEAEDEDSEPTEHVSPPGQRACRAEGRVSRVVNAYDAISSPESKAQLLDRVSRDHAACLAKIQRTTDMYGDITDAVLSARLRRSLREHFATDD